MIVKNGKTFFLEIALLMILILGCEEKRVIITKDYVINPNWSATSNSFQITKMHPKDSNKAIDLKECSEVELYNGLIEDTNFSFVANVKYNGEVYATRKVYFNRYNGFLWCNLNNMYSNCKQKIIGELHQNTWYLLAGLSQFKVLYYLYCDSSDSLYVFKVSTMTNY